MAAKIKPDTGTGRQKRRKVGRFIKIALLLLVLILLPVSIWAFAIEPDQLSITRLTITDSDLPENWDGRVIALFSDTHVGPTFDANRLSRVAAAIEVEQPDLVVFGGDLIDHRTPSDEAFTDAISNCLTRMDAPLGQYAVIGNHDNYLAKKLALATQMLEDGGFTVLTNESVSIDGILLGGMDEKFFGRPDLAATFPADPQTDGLWRLLLAHQPDFAAAYAGGSANLILSGHTHNGQVTLFGFPLHMVNLGSQYVYGTYPLASGSQIVVTRGLGTIGPAARLGAPPELMLITLCRG